jgi:hypothetical protein
MKAQRRWIVAMFTLAILATSAVVIAQEKAQKNDRPVIVERSEGFMRVQSPDGNVRMPAMAMGDGATSIFVSSEMGFGGKVVKGAPYSAQAVTESVQALADGNRIVRKTTASVYRDGEGRTRRDQQVGSIGPYAVAGDPAQTIFINDPVANVHYVLDPRTHSARKMTVTHIEGMRDKIEGAGGKATIIQVTPPASIEERHAVEVAAAEIAGSADVRHAVPMRKGHGPAVAGGSSGNFVKKEPVVESLGKQTIEGVEVEGTRSTITIAAGEIGNELPIQIVFERWYSPELQQIVMSKQTDPRFGETTYRLTGINRSEPARALFEVPADYTIKESIRPDVRTKIDAEIQRAKKRSNENEQ